MEMYIIPDNVAAEYNGAVKDNAGLQFRKDNQNRCVVNTTVAPLWPEIPWDTFEIADLTINDFPEIED